MSYSKSIIIISAKIYFLYKGYKNNHINSFINAQLYIINICIYSIDKFNELILSNKCKLS